MSQTRTCPHHAPSSRAQQGHGGAGTPASWVAAPAATPRDDGRATRTDRTISGWWAFCAQASSVEARG